MASSKQAPRKQAPVKQAPVRRVMHKRNAEEEIRAAAESPTQSKTPAKKAKATIKGAVNKVLTGLAEVKHSPRMMRVAFITTRKGRKAGCTVTKAGFTSKTDQDRMGVLAVSSYWLVEAPTFAPAHAKARKGDGTLVTIPGREGQYAVGTEVPNPEAREDWKPEGKQRSKQRSKRARK